MDSVCGCTFGQCAKAGHIVLALFTYLGAFLAGTAFLDYFEDIYGIDLYSRCDPDHHYSCALDEVLYRATAALSIVIGLTGIGSFFYSSAHTGLWSLKYGAVYLIWMGFMFCENHGFNKFANWCRALSAIWLCLQSLLVLEISMQLSETALREAAKGASMGLFYFGVIFMVCSGIIGTYYLYANYADCPTGFWFVNVTTGLNALCLFISNISVEGQPAGVGMFSGSVLFAYTTFLCWYALLSSPDTACNPEAEEDILFSSKKISCLWLIGGVSLICLSYMAWSGTRVLGVIFGGDEMTSFADMAASAQAGESQDGTMKEVLTTDVTETTPIKSEPNSGGDEEKGDDEEGGKQKSASGSGNFCWGCFTSGEAASTPRALGEPREEVLFFHAILLTAIFYGLMAVTSWAPTNGAPDALGDSTEVRASMWIKIGVQWLTFAFFLIVSKNVYNDTVEEQDQFLFPWEIENVRLNPDLFPCCGDSDKDSYS